eukprot:223110_1
MASKEQSSDTNANATFTFKKFMGNVTSSSKLFTKKDDKNNSVLELQEQIEILELQKKDLRELLQHRTYELDQLKKLDGEHQKLRDRYKANENKLENDCKHMKNELIELKKQ